MSHKPRLLIATTNAGKLREVRAILEDLAAELVGLGDLPPMPEATEDGATFEENAARKAIHYATLSRLATLADDSGLCVDALGGAPGVNSARYAGTHGNDQANNRKLIAALAGLPESLRSARFVCAVALATPEGLCGVARGEVEGIILDEPRGTGGFGYDPHFQPTGFHQTTSQLSAEQKNAISHRGQAVRAMRKLVQRVLSNQ